MGAVVHVKYNNDVHIITARADVKLPREGVGILIVSCFERHTETPTSDAHTYTDAVTA